MCALIGVIYVIGESQKQQNRTNAKLNAMTYTERIYGELMEGIGVTDTLKQVVISGDGNINKFYDIAANMMDDSIQSIQIAPNGVVNEIYPGDVNESGKIDLINDSDRGEISRYARDNDTVIMQGPLKLKQGVMIGYACDETKQLMPMPVVLANRIVRELSACRQSSYIQGILPDGKAQVTVEYENGKPVRLDSVVVSCQHTEEKDLKKLEAEIRKKVLLPVLRPLPPDEETKIYINPSGRFVCGGLDADTGLTGRKLMVDSYGSMVPHGGGAFSGKDCSKVDRSAAYMARYIAKNIVAAGLASKCQVSLAYAIGVAQPVMVQVNTFGTGKVCADDCLELAIPLVFGLTPKQIVDSLRLTRPIFRQTAAFGHFGRKEFPWERTDKVEALRNAVI